MNNPSSHIYLLNQDREFCVTYTVLHVDILKNVLLSNRSTTMVVVFSPTFVISAETVKYDIAVCDTVQEHYHSM